MDGMPPRENSDSGHNTRSGGSAGNQIPENPGRGASSTRSITKVSYAISCSTAFRDAVTSLAEKRSVNVGDIARSVMLTIPEDVISKARDPGEPKGDDREEVILKSGPSAGKPWRRKPRLQVRLPAGFDPVTIRKALGIALDLERGEMRLNLESADAEPATAKAIALAEKRTSAFAEQVSRLKAMISTLSFEPLAHGVRTRDEALYVLGFPPGSSPDGVMIKARYRMLATVHHPDSGVGSHDRMAQLNSAISFLRTR